MKTVYSPIHAILLAWTLALGPAASAGEEELAVAPPISLSTLEEAKEVLPGIKENYLRVWGETEVKNRRPIQIVHVGTKIPAPIELIATELHFAGIPAEVELISPEKIISLTEESFDQESKKMRFDLTPAEKLSAQERLKEWKSRLRVAFGLEEGITLWGMIKEGYRGAVRYQKNTDPKMLGLTAKLSALSGLVSAGSLALSFTLKEPPHLMAPVAAEIALATWVYLNGYFGSPIFQMMARGKSLGLQKMLGSSEVQKGPKGGEIYRISDNGRFLYLTNVLRSLMSNAVIVGTAFGLDVALAPLALAISLKNSAINSSARTWGDAWVGSKRPMILPNGTVDVLPGQWTLTKWNVVNVAWNAVYGMIKNLDLLGLPIGSTIYYTLAVLGPVVHKIRTRQWDPSKFKILPGAKDSASADTETSGDAEAVAEVQKTVLQAEKRICSWVLIPRGATP